MCRLGYSKDWCVCVHTRCMSLHIEKHCTPVASLTTSCSGSGVEKHALMLLQQSLQAQGFHFLLAWEQQSFTSLGETEMAQPATLLG